MTKPEYVLNRYIELDKERIAKQLEEEKKKKEEEDKKKREEEEKEKREAEEKERKEAEEKERKADEDAKAEEERRVKEAADAQVTYSYLFLLEETTNFCSEIPMHEMAAWDVMTLR